jgi:hypothetical protein
MFNGNELTNSSTELQGRFLRGGSPLEERNSRD